MKALILPIVLIAGGCAGRFDAGAQQHVRHEANSLLLHDIKISSARAKAVARCAGEVELVAEQEGVHETEYRCVSR